MIELDEPLAGDYISSVCDRAVAMANDKKEEVHFVFNGVDVVVAPGEAAATVEQRWRDTMDENHKALIESAEYKQHQAELEAEELRKHAASLKESAQTEEELRNTRAPWPYTKEQLVEYIDSLIEREHDYGTCVYAMSLAATAAFNYIAGKLGTTGFQASCADLDFLRRTRSIEGPFMLLRGADALYPQYDLTEKLQTALNEWRPWLKEEATKKLQETPGAHPDVIAHWGKLAQ